MSKIFLAITSVIILLGCSPLPPEKHIIKDSGSEFGVELEVLLKDGGSAKLVCPKFIGEPLGSHGRECYIRSYNKVVK